MLGKSRRPASASSGYLQVEAPQTRAEKAAFHQRFPLLRMIPDAPLGCMDIIRIGHGIKQWRLYPPQPLSDHIRRSPGFRDGQGYDSDVSAFLVDRRGRFTPLDRQTFIDDAITPDTAWVITIFTPPIGYTVWRVGIVRPYRVP